MMVPVTQLVKRGILSNYKKREGQTEGGRETETLWEVISLPVLAVCGQPSGAATSLCPSEPRLSAVLLQGERKRRRRGEEEERANIHLHTKAGRGWTPHGTNKDAFQKLQRLIGCFKGVCWRWCVGVCVCDLCK